MTYRINPRRHSYHADITPSPLVYFEHHTLPRAQDMVGTVTRIPRARNQHQEGTTSRITRVQTQEGTTMGTTKIPRARNHARPRPKVKPPSPPIPHSSSFTLISSPHDVIPASILMPPGTYGTGTMDSTTRSGTLGSGQGTAKRVRFGPKVPPRWSSLWSNTASEKKEKR